MTFNQNLIIFYIDIDKFTNFTIISFILKLIFWTFHFENHDAIEVK